MANFSGPEGDLFSIYLSETDILERYVGNQLWGWGENTYGQLGDNSITHRSSPVQTVSGGTNWKHLSLGAENSACLKTDGTLWVWGRNFYGVLGDNTIVDKSSPVQTVAGGTNWKQVSSSGYVTAAVKTDGTLWLWGQNSYGQLGDNAIVHRSSPVQTVAGGTNWKQVSCGGDYTAAIKTDGTLWMWGFNGQGQLGDNTAISKSSPVQTVSGGTNWKQVSCSAGGHAAAIKNDGTLWMWGYNAYGQLGNNGLLMNMSSPIQTAAGGTNWRQVSCGGYMSSAVKTDSTLWTWGINDVGQLGDGTRANKSSPVQTIAGGTNWKQASASGYSTAAIKTDGTLWTWGSNLAGQLGDNSVTSRSSPVQTVAGGTNWKQVSCGTSSTNLALAAITYTES